MGIHNVNNGFADSLINYSWFINPMNTIRVVISTIIKNHRIQPFKRQLNSIFGAPSCRYVVIHVSFQNSWNIPNGAFKAGGLGEINPASSICI